MKMAAAQNDGSTEEPRDGLAVGIESIDLEELVNNRVAISDDEEATFLEEFHLPAYEDQIALSHENKAALFEILRCAVCLEVPKFRSNLQVKTCVMGHHFCTYCHKKLKKCAICRGGLKNGRNFVVEELITKLGSPLGISNPPLSAPPIPPSAPKGSYYCPHNCGCRLRSSALLPHVRDVHPESLKDKVRSNPYTGWFECAYSIIHQPGMRQAFSFQVSDMGLLTLVIIFPSTSGGPFRAWVQSLTEKENALFKYRLQFRNGGSSFGAVDLPVLTYEEAHKTTPQIEYGSTVLPPAGEPLVVSLLVNRTTNTTPIPDIWPMLRQIAYTCDRKSRRCSARNKRRSLLRKRIRQVQLPSEPEKSAGTSTIV